MKDAHALAVRAPVPKAAIRSSLRSISSNERARTARRSLLGLDAVEQMRGAAHDQHLVPSVCAILTRPRQGGNDPRPANAAVRRSSAGALISPISANISALAPLPGCAPTSLSGKIIGAPPLSAEMGRPGGMSITRFSTLPSPADQDCQRLARPTWTNSTCFKRELPASP